jgi:hypothetical protein
LRYVNKARHFLRLAAHANDLKVRLGAMPDGQIVHACHTKIARRANQARDINAPASWSSRPGFSDLLVEMRQHAAQGIGIVLV